MQTWRINRTTATTGLRRWQDGLASAFVRLDAQAVKADDFAGSIEQARLPGGEVSRVSATAHRIVRRVEHCRRAEGDTLFANLQISGRGEVETPWDAHRPGPMDLSVVATSEPYRITHAGDFSLFSFALPRASLPMELRPGLIRLSRSAAGRELSGVLGGLGALAMRMPDQARALETQIRSTLLLALSIRTGDDDAEALRTAIRAFIARRHADPGLSAAPIAASFDLTVRDLHRLFDPTGRTVGALIEAARLASAEEMLQATDLPISIVAARSGFRDPSYFGRVFRRRRGQSPRDWRAARSS